MKIIGYILTGLFLVTAANSASAQQDMMPDSVEFRLNDHKHMAMVAMNFYELKEWGSINSMYNLFLSDLEKIEGQLLNKQTANNFTYALEGPYRKIAVNSETAVENEVSFDEDGTLIYFQTVTFKLNEVEQIVFCSPNMEGFKAFGELDLDALIKSGQEALFPEGRGKNSHIMTTFFVSDGKIVSDKTIANNRAMDTLELGFGIGLGTVRSTLTPDVEVRLLANLSKKGADRFQFGGSFEAMYFFHNTESGNMDVRSNMFVSMVFARSVQNSRTNRSRMAGFKAGTTVVRQDETFNGNAYKFGFYYEMGSRFTLEPSVIFENNFKTAFPAIRLAIVL